MSKKIAIVYALHKELETLIRDLKITDSQTIDKTEFARSNYQGHDLMLVLAGVGGKNVHKSLDRLYELMVPDVLILTGFAGAADPAYKSGSIVIPDKIGIYDNGTMAAAMQSTVRAGLGVTVETGTMVTVPRVYFKEDKARLRRVMGDKISVDMEAGFVTEWALRQRINFVVVKAISDTYSFKLPSYPILIKFFSKKQPRHLIKEIFLHPIEFYRLTKLAGNCRKAEHNLKKALETILSVM